MKPIITFCKPDLSGKIAPLCGTMDSYLDDGRRSLESIKQSAWEELSDGTPIQKPIMPGLSFIMPFPSHGAPCTKPMKKLRIEPLI